MDSFQTNQNFQGLKTQVNAILTRQFRFGCLVEQLPLSTNRVTLSSDFKDNLGLPRPQITYDLDPWTLTPGPALPQPAKPLNKSSRS